LGDAYTRDDTADEYLAGQIAEALATDARTNELGITVSVHGGVVLLRGVVAAALRRELAAEVAAQAAPGMRIQNDISVPEAAPASPERGTAVIRIAAVGDVHMAEDLRGRLRPLVEGIAADADVLLLAGDLTQHGTLSEGRVVAAEFGGLPVPVVAVLGNHDYHSDEQGLISAVLGAEGITVLEGSGVVIETPAGSLGVAGTKGFGGGFPGRCAAAFGEREMKQFVAVSQQLADDLRGALAGLDAQVRVALTHYSPVPDTLAGEPPEIFPFLGSYLLAQAADEAGADLMLHGHAHAGTEKGLTPGGIEVRNVAMPVLGRPYATYHIDTEASGSPDSEQSPASRRS
jgi:Icc-related predicted phosphoesterase